MTLWVVVGHVDPVSGLVELEEGDRVQQAPGRLSRLEPLSGLGGGPRGWLRAEAKDC